MTLPKYKELAELKTLLDIEKEISNYEKVLFNLRIKISTKGEKQSHLISHTKRRIAQLNFKKQNFSQN